MSGERFTLDTNILVYALAGNPDARRQRAEHIINLARRCDCWLTLQSVSEFYAAVTRKRLASRAQAAAQANDWRRIGMRCWWRPRPRLAARPS